LLKVLLGCLHQKSCLCPFVQSQQPLTTVLNLCLRGSLVYMVNALQSSRFMSMFTWNWKKKFMNLSQNGLSYKHCYVSEYRSNWDLQFLFEIFFIWCLTKFKKNYTFLYS
jgi:hypothetical protein